MARTTGTATDRGTAKNGFTPNLVESKKRAYPPAPMNACCPTLTVRSISVRNCGTSASHRDRNRDAGRARCLRSVAASQDREHGLTKCCCRITGETVASPGVEAIRPPQQPAMADPLADLYPSSGSIMEVVGEAD